VPLLWARYERLLRRRFFGAKASASAKSFSRPVASLFLRSCGRATTLTRSVPILAMRRRLWHSAKSTPSISLRISRRMGSYPIRIILPRRKNSAGLTFGMLNPNSRTARANFAAFCGESSTKTSKPTPATEDRCSLSQRPGGTGVSQYFRRRLRHVQRPLADVWRTERGAMARQ